MDRKESDHGHFAEFDFPDDDVMRERVTPRMTLNTNGVLAADEVFDIHCTCVTIPCYRVLAISR